MSSNSYVNLKIATCLVRYADDRLIDQRFPKLSVSTAAKCERPATGPPFWPGFIAHRLPRAPMTRKTG
ncbi:hypothetical protein A8E12_21085 [Burkholderia cenocepacia]|nr:hypothetical protein A8E12_21085 [Burkholderia cenocepacia]